MFLKMKTLRKLSSVPFVYNFPCLKYSIIMLYFKNIICHVIYKILKSCKEALVFPVHILLQFNFINIRINCSFHEISIKRKCSFSLFCNIKFMSLLICKLQNLLLFYFIINI